MDKELTKEQFLCGCSGIIPQNHDTHPEKDSKHLALHSHEYDSSDSGNFLGRNQSIRESKPNIQKYFEKNDK